MTAAEAPRGRSRPDVVEICLVGTCDRITRVRGLCMRHYNSLGKALKAGREWDLATGKVVPTGHRPRSPFETPNGLTPTLPNGQCFADLGEVKHMVEVDAARVLPHVMAWCIAEMLRESGLTKNPEALQAFSEAIGQPLQLTKGRQ